MEYEYWRSVHPLFPKVTYYRVCGDSVEFRFPHMECWRPSVYRVSEVCEPAFERVLEAAGVFSAPSRRVLVRDAEF